jgi:glycerol-3-phosphate dehydrogenase (NAD(P)+)
MKKTVCVVGEGAWGTAIASLLVDNGYRVKLWCNDPGVELTIKKRQENERYLPGITLNSLIEPTHDIEKAVADVEWVFCSTPVPFLRSVLMLAKGSYRESQTWIMLNKGIEQETFMFPTQIIADIFGSSVHTAVVSGPSFARDLIFKQTTGFVVASEDKQCADQVKIMLKNEYTETFFSTDAVGVQACAALKNVIAIGIGVLEGAGYTDNTKAFFLTCGLQEIAHLVTALGGDIATVLGLAGVGDLVLTSMGSQGRNLAIGKRLGQGATVKELKRSAGTLPEGINTITSIYHLMQQQKIIMPVHQALYHVVIDGDPVTELIDVLSNYAATGVVEK